MGAKLSEDLRREIDENPGQAVPLVDERTGKTYYVCDADFLLGPGEHDEASRQRLIALIEEGLASPKVPKEEAEARIRAKLATITDKPA